MSATFGEYTLLPFNVFSASSIRQSISVVLMSSQITCDRVILTLSTALPAGEKSAGHHPIAKALQRVNLDPQLPPQGILVVRKLSPDQPLANAWRPMRAWEQQTQTQITQNWRTAARPALDPVPASANAVWFADTAEWLACLSWDLFQGTARQRWWWQSWLKRPQPSLSHTLFHLWQPEARWLPHTLRLLYTRHGQSIETLIAQLTDAQAIALIQHIQTAYQLPASAIAAYSPPHPLSPSSSPSPPSPLSPNLPLSLPAAARTFTQLCFTLAYNPTFLREPAPREPTPPSAFPNSNEPSTESLALQSLTPPISTTESSISQPLMSSSFSPTDSALNGPDSSEHSSASPPARPSALNQDAQAQRKYSPEPELKSSSRADHSPSPGPPSTLPLEADLQNSPPSLPEIDHPSSTPSPLHPSTPPPIPTQLGGLWYLINVLVPLNWPHPDLCPNPWHQLYALAQHLLDEPTPDSVWQLLLDLSETDLPDDLTPWLAATLPELDQYLTTLSLPSSLASPSSPSSPSLHLPSSLSSHLPTPAEIHPSRTHIDIVFSLDQISLDLRLAGLDRDPGWVPELARVITFHYL